MEIGTSRDLATCKGVRKSDGRSCTMFINKQYGDYCEFHVQKAFKKAKAGRMELQSGGSKGPRNGTTSKNQKGHLMNDMKKSIDMGDYHYGGKTLSLSENKKRNNVKLQKTSNGAGAGGGGLRSIVSSDVKALAAKDLQETKMKREKQKLELQGGTEEFKELLNVPTVGARNLHKLLKGDQVKEEEIKVPKSKCNSARSFLRNTKQEFLQTNPQLNRNLSPSIPKPDPAQKKRKLCDVEFFETTTSSDKKDKPKKLSVDKRNESNEREMTFESDEKVKRRKSSTDQTTNNLTPNGGDKTNNLTLNSGDKATKRTLNGGDKITKSTLNDGDRTTKSTLNGGDKTTKSTLNGGDKTNKATPNGGDKTERKDEENNNQEPIRKKEKINLNKLILDKSKAPMLGRGLRNSKSDFEEDFLCYDKYTGEDTSVSQISYGNDKGLTETLERSTNKQQLQQNGPTLKPTKAKLAAIQKIRSKGGIHDNEDKKNKQQTSEHIKARLENSLDKSNDEGAGDENDEVPKKKRKKGLLQDIFGELDPNSEEAIKLHKAKSKNVGAVRLAEAEREDKYFAALEKKEAMEQKMINTTEIKVRLYACKVCNYKAESLLKKCLDEKHLHVKLPDRIKRFFACKNCKHKAIGYDCLLPKNPCSKCGGTSFERSSMVNERKGPKMGAETLELRGREQKYANSLA
uniref:Protein MCM10 homolog n=2 Tax=Clytia hemisphaerica TaxID=252671 RepID=A0A7M5XDA4_9CNID